MSFFHFQREEINMAISLNCKGGTLPRELQELLTTLGEEYPIKTDGSGDLEVAFQKSSSPDILNVSRDGNRAVISYGRTNHAARGIGTLLAGLPAEGESITETIPFTSFGIMLDCSRNAVMKVDHFKKWLRRLALFGYNMAMLYTEDTYELAGEFFFGHLRGRYTAEEMKEINRYADNLGIEMIGCIQTLGHLRQILKWPAYKHIKDTSSVVLVGEEETYNLIDKMIGFYDQCFTSRRLHVGMDEAWDLGRGRYMDLHGYRRGFDIFNEHLARVVESCAARGLEPMIWSDMYFRMGSQDGDYYDRNCVIPADVAAAIPGGVQLVYWDYYHKDAEFYSEWIRRHRELGSEPVMASGVWTWSKLWYHHRQTRQTVGPCLHACREQGVKEVFFTLWGDDGAYCEFDSAMAGLCYAAQSAFGGAEPDDATLERRFRAVCGGEYQTMIMPDEAFNNMAPGARLLWAPPLMESFSNAIEGNDGREERLGQYLACLTDLVERLQPAAAAGTGAADLEHALRLALALQEKVALRLKLIRAYPSRDRARLEEVREDAGGVADAMEQLSESFRRQWYRRNKPQGFEELQCRLAGQSVRHRELQKRIDELLSGETDSIPELDEVLFRETPQ